MRPRPPLVMGVVNATPDSFSDGGRYDPIIHGLELAEEGADWLDVGGESTRPGASPVSAEEEIRRVAGLIGAFASEGVRVSVDTTKAVVARRAIELGATMVNDVSAGEDPAMLPLVARAEVEIVLMHRRGNPRTMQRLTGYDDVVTEVRDALLARARAAEAAGISRERIWLDPGIGFAKDDANNFALLRSVDSLAATGYRVLVGASRKGFLGRATDDADVEDRYEQTLAAHAAAWIGGAAMVRTHDVIGQTRFARVFALSWPRVLPTDLDPTLDRP